MQDSPTVERVASVCLIALGLCTLFWFIPTQTVEVDPGELPGSLLPSAAAWLVVICAAFQLLGSLRSSPPAGSVSEGASSWRTNLIFFAGSAIVLSLILAAIAWFGYVIGGILGILVVGLALRPSGASRWWLLLAAALIPGAVYYLAWQLLRLSLP